MTNTPEKPRKALNRPSLRRWGAYCAKTLLFLGLLYAFSSTAGSLTPLALALVWAALSLVLALAATYSHTVRRTVKQHELKDGGRLSRLNNGRILCLAAAFVLAALCVAGLMLKTPHWDWPLWCLVAGAAALYPAVYRLMDKTLRGEFREPYRVRHAVKLSNLVVLAVLLAGYAVLYLVQPAPNFESASDAFLAAGQPFENSPSALAADIGKFAALSDGLAAFAVSKAAGISSWLYVVLELVVNASAFAALAGLLGTCALELRELKRSFLPLAPDGAQSPDSRIVGRYVAAACILPTLLVAAFLIADHRVSEISKTQEYTAVESFVRDQVGLAVCVLDGTYYDWQAVQDLVAETTERSQRLSQEAAATLVPLINASFDARVANVDAYLDWYYSLPADYERLATLITGTTEEFVQQQFTDIIEQGVDDTELERQLANYTGQATALRQEFVARLAQYEVTGVPEWLITVKDVTAADLIDQSLAPAWELIEAGTRLGAGVGAGVVANKVAQKAIRSEVLAKVVKKIGETLAARGVGAATGGAVGAIGGPLGTAIGIAAGTAVSIGVDYGLVKLDELQNRESDRQELVDAIEEGRTDMLAMVGC